MDIQKLVLATTPHQARLALMILKTLYREAKLYGMTEKTQHLGPSHLNAQRQKDYPSPSIKKKQVSQINAKPKSDFSFFTV
jgi:hypothetical protein